MRYTGLVGEFKWWGFFASLALCLGSALLLFNRVSYVKDTTQEVAKAANQSLELEVKAMQATVDRLEQRISVVEQKVPSQGSREGEATQKRVPAPKK